MAHLKLFPIIINDYLPFLALSFAYTEKQALANLELQFPNVEDFGACEVMEPVIFGQGKTMIIDPELYIIKDNEDLMYWLGDQGEYYRDDFDAMKLEQKNRKENGDENSDENTEDDSVRGNLDEESGDKSETTSEKSGEKEEKEISTEVNATLWV